MHGDIFQAFLFSGQSKLKQLPRDAELSFFHNAIMNGGINIIYVDSHPDYQFHSNWILLKVSIRFNLDETDNNLKAWKFTFIQRDSKIWFIGWHIWASYQIRKIAGCACAGNAGNVFPRRRFPRKPLVSDPGMHHGTCVTHVPWCMSGSLTCGDEENVPGIPGACAPAILRIWQVAHGWGLCGKWPWPNVANTWLLVDSAEVRAWWSNYIPHKTSDAINKPCPNLRSTVYDKVTV